MSAPETSFDGIAGQFADYGESVRGYVRYELTHQNLGDLVCGEALKVADIGGGAAVDAAWLAEQGHDVTIVEPAIDQITEAKKRITNLPAQVSHNIRILQGTADDILDRGHEAKYDLVLSHGVAMYLRDPEAFVSQLFQLAKPGGYVSLLEKGFHGTEQRLLREQNWADLRYLQRHHKMPLNRMGREVHAFLPAQLESMIKKARGKVIEWSGVRFASDTIDQPLTDFDQETLDLIVETEARQGSNKAIRGQGQMLHFIAQKPLI